MTIEALSYWIAVIVGLLSAVAFAWSAVRYVQVRRAEIQQRRFENLDRLVRIYAGWSPDRPGGSVALAHQLMAAYEFRNYPEYRGLFDLLLKNNRFNGPHADLINGTVAQSIDATKRWGIGRSA